MNKSNRGKTNQTKTTATAHLDLKSHSLANIYRGFVLNTEGRQISPAQAMDELIMLGAVKKLPRPVLESSGFNISFA